MKTKEEQLAYQREWHLKNRDRLIIKRREWYAKNREKAREYQRTYQKRWAAANQDKVVRYRQIGHIRHRDINLTRSKKYHRDNIDLVTWFSLRGRSRRAGMPFILTKDEFRQWYRAQPQQCSYCDLVDLTLDDSLTSGRRACRFTIDRKNSQLPYTLENMTMSCWICNKSKGSLFNYEEFRDIAQRYIKPKWLARVEAVRVA